PPGGPLPPVRRQHRPGPHLVPVEQRGAGAQRPGDVPIRAERAGEEAAGAGTVLTGASVNNQGRRLRRGEQEGGALPEPRGLPDALVLNGPLVAQGAGGRRGQVKTLGVGSGDEFRLVRGQGLDVAAPAAVQADGAEAHPVTPSWPRARTRRTS